MIVGPTPNFGVEFTDQIGGRHAQRSSDYLPDAAQESLNVLLGRPDEQFPILDFVRVARRTPGIETIFKCGTILKCTLLQFTPRETQ